MDRRHRCKGLSWFVGIVISIGAPLARAEAPAQGTVVVTLTPSERALQLHLRADDDSEPSVSCDGACTVRVRTGASYELSVRDAHGTSVRGMHFSQSESLLVSPPNRTTHLVGKSLLYGGVTLVAVSTPALVYAGIRNLSLQECEGDCSGVPRGVVLATLVGTAAGLSIMLAGGVVTLSSRGPGVEYLRPRTTMDPSAADASGARSRVARSNGHSHGAFASWRIEF